MGLKPEYRITANSNDITAAIRDRFVSLRFTDESGTASDVLELTLSDQDPDNPVLLPPTGAELELWLGYDGALDRMGMFVCDELEVGGWPAEIVIRARAAVYDKTPQGKTDLQTQKTRSWPKGTKLGDMVAKIAKEHGMQSVVAASLKGTVLPHLDQDSESDINFLLRVAKRYDAIVKPAGGKLTLAKRGETKSASGKQLPTITVRPTDCGAWRMVQSKRETAGQVVAYYHATKQAKRHEVKVGTGEPVRRLKNYFPTQEMALAAARADLDKRERGAVTLTLQVVGDTKMAAECPLTLAGFRQGVPTSWVITRAEHLVDEGGYSCRVEAEIPKAANDNDQVEDVADAA